MATFDKRGDLQWRAQIRRKGYPIQRKTFNSRAEAEAWAKTVESEMIRGVFRSSKEAERTTLKAALDRYLEEVSVHKRGHTREKKRIEKWKAHPLASRFLASITPKDISEYHKERREAGYSERTIWLEVAILSHLFNYARAKWGMDSLENPVAPTRVKGTDPDKKKRGNHEGRDRVLSREEQEKLLDKLSQEMRWIVTIAVETGMRRGEIMSLSRQNIDLAKRLVKLDRTKNGDSRSIFLSEKAYNSLKEVMNQPVRNIDGSLWTRGADNVTSIFARATRSAELKDLRFHDLRHTAATRLAPFMQVHELAKYLGHRTVNMVMRYYNPSGDETGTRIMEAEKLGLI